MKNLYSLLSGLTFFFLVSFNTLFAQTTPNVQSVTSITDEGTYAVGDIIEIRIIFSESVNVIGTPTLKLETGTADAVVNYSGGSGPILNFNYTVSNGESSPDLDYFDTSSLSLNSGTIKATDDNTNATLTLAAPGENHSLGEAKNYVIDGIAPTIMGTTIASDNSAISVTLSDAVYDTNGGSGVARELTEDIFGLDFINILYS